MADRFYGYQYDTNPRKLNYDYTQYRKKYPQNEEPVKTTNKKRSDSKARKKSYNNARKNSESKERKNSYNKATKKSENEVRKNSYSKVTKNSENKARKNSEYKRANKRHRDIKQETQLNNGRIQVVKEKNDININQDNSIEKVSKASVKAKLKIVMYLITGFSVLFAIGYQNSLISESFNKKEQLKKEMEALTKTNQQIEVSIENNLNLNNIEQAAKEQLGMQKLNNNQKIYVSLPKEDYVAPATEQVVIEEDANFFQKLINGFTKSVK